MKRKIKVLFLICIVFLIGFFYTAAVYLNIIHKIQEGFSFYPWYVHILFIILCLHVTIAVHELGHFISLRRQGIGVKAIYVMMLTFVKRDSRWRFRLLPKFALMIGGLVMPIIDNLDSDEALETMKIKMSKAIGAGPKASLYYGIATTLFLLLAICFHIPAVTGIAVTLGIVNGVLTILVMISSNHSAQGLYGDFVASKQLNKNELFLTAYMISGQSVSNTEEVNGDYLWPRVVKLLDTYALLYNEQSATLAQFYLEEIIFKKRIGCTSIDYKVMHFLDRAPKDETSMIIWFYALYYKAFYMDMESAILKYQQTDFKSLKVRPKVKLYWTHLTEHLFSIEDHTVYFKKMKYDESTSTAWILKPIEDKYSTYQEILQIIELLLIENKEK